MNMLIALLLTCVGVAQPPAQLIEAPGGVALLIWTNDVQADGIAVINLARTAETCAYPVVTAVDPGLTGQFTSIPEGPPYEERCLLRPGDRFYLQRYRNKHYTDQIGPFVVPVRVWLPGVVR